MESGEELGWGQRVLGYRRVGLQACGDRLRGVAMWTIAGRGAVTHRLGNRCHGHAHRAVDPRVECGPFALTPTLSAITRVLLTGCRFAGEVARARRGRGVVGQI